MICAHLVAKELSLFDVISEDWLDWFGSQAGLIFLGCCCSVSLLKCLDSGNNQMTYVKTRYVYNNCLEYDCQFRLTETFTGSSP